MHGGQPILVVTSGRSKSWKVASCGAARSGTEERTRAAVYSREDGVFYLFAYFSNFLKNKYL